MNFRTNALLPPSWGLRIVARGGAGGARAEIGLRQRNGQGLGTNLRVGPGWSETVVPASELLPLWGLPSREAFRWDEVEQLSVLTGAWLFRDEPAGPQDFDLAALDRVPLAPALRVAAVDGAAPWSLFDVQAWLRAADWSHGRLRRWRVTDDRGAAAVHLGAEGFDGENSSLSLRVPCDGPTYAQLWPDSATGTVVVVRARALTPKTTAFELALIESGGVAWGTNVPLTAEWQTVRIPLTKLRLFTQWDRQMAALAGPQLRIDRLDRVNVCFGRWLYPASAGEPHAFEIADIALGQ